MDEAEATLIISSLLGRLTEQFGVFVLPGGRLSSLEVAALTQLVGETGHVGVTDEYAERVSGLSADTEGAVEQGSGAKHGEVVHTPSEISLVLTSANVVGPNERDMRLCLDFGTAMSKAWAAYDSIAEPIVINLGEAIGEDEQLAVPSTIYIAGSGRLFFGGAAERQHRQEFHLGRQRFDNIKRVLSEAEIYQNLHEVPLDSSIDPTVSGVTKGDLLVLYLAWLTDHAIKALQESVCEEGEALEEEDLAKLRCIRRRFAIPCFESAVEETLGGAARSIWANGVMRESMLRAQIVADTLGDRWQELNMEVALPVLRAVRDVDLAGHAHLLASNASVREPIAAGASRFGDQIEEEEQRSRKFLFVVDAGAGTTDFAMFQVFVDPDRADEEVRYGLIPPSVKMSRIAGNEVDAILRPLFLQAAGIDPFSGAPRSPEDFLLIKQDLDYQIRESKQILFSEGETRYVLRPNVSGVLSWKQLKESADYRDLGRKLIEIRAKIMSDLFSNEESFLRTVKTVNEASGKAAPIHVLLTGGSSTVPILADLAHGTTSVEGARFEFRKVRDLPMWVDRLDWDIRDLLEQPYRQCAVAIGGAAPLLPAEVQDLESPITPAPAGDWRLERFPTRGI